MAALPLSRGPKRGRNCYVSPALSGVPNAKRGEKIRSGCLTPAFSGAQKRAELLRNPCILRGSQRQAASRSTKRSTHARPGMHMQQCSAVPLIRWFHVHLSVCTGCTDVCHVTLLSSRVLSAITSSLHVTILGFEVYRRLDRLAVCWLSIGQPVMSSHSTLRGGQVCVCVRLILIYLTTQIVALMWL